MGPSNYSRAPPASAIRSRRASAAHRTGARSGGKELLVARKRREPANAGFADFLQQLIRIVFLPITLPVRISYRLLTSPSTISIGIKLALLTFLLVLSAGLTAIALAGFWYTGRAGGIVEVEGWFVYGSKTTPTPHAYIRLNQPEKLFSQGVGYDVDVEMELVRPRRLDAEDLGNFMLGVEFYSQSSGALVTSVSQPCLPAQPYVPPSFPTRVINTIASPALHFLRLPFTISPTSLIPNPLNLLRSGSTRRKRRRRAKSGRETFLLTRPVISSFSGLNGYSKVGSRGAVVGREAFEGGGLVMRPDGGAAGTVGAVQVTVGREDGAGKGEVKTTGWVVVRFTPRPTGLRYIFASHPIILLLIVPPIALFMTLSSATFGYFIISLIFSRPVQAKQPRPLHDNQHTRIVASDKAASDDPTVAKESSGRTSSSPNQPKETSSVPSNTTRSQNVPSPAEDASHQTTTTTRPVERELIGREKVTESEETGGTSTTCSSVVSSTAEDGSDSGTVTH